MMSWKKKVLVVVSQFIPDLPFLPMVYVGVYADEGGELGKRKAPTRKLQSKSGT